MLVSTWKHVPMFSNDSHGYVDQFHMVLRNPLVPLQLVFHLGHGVPALLHFQLELLLLCDQCVQFRDEFLLSRGQTYRWYVSAMMKS